MCTTFLLENLQRIDKLDHTVIDIRIRMILKWIVKKCDVSMRTGFNYRI
jgi:hypothetical protein